MPIIRIDDPADPRLADYRNIPDWELVERAGLFVAEGRLVVRRLLGDARLATRSVMVTETALAALGDIIWQNASAAFRDQPVTRHDPPVYVVPRTVMNGITGFNIHRGCLALGERPPARDWRRLAEGARRLVVMERLGNADNVGSIFRTAAAFGADAVLLGPSCADPLYRKAIRTSMGAALTMPFAEIGPWPDALLELRWSGMALVGLTPAAALRLREVPGPIGARPAAVLVGHEGDGLTDAALELCEFRVRIPIVPEVDSLNVAIAAAIALYRLTESTGI
jgi:tRNA G18 (ribose-2'-O)-methylase SpoU